MLAGRFTYGIHVAFDDVIFCVTSLAFFSLFFSSSCCDGRRPRRSRRAAYTRAPYTPYTHQPTALRRTQGKVLELLEQYAKLRKETAGRQGTSTG